MAVSISHFLTAATKFSSSLFVVFLSLALKPRENGRNIVGQQLPTLLDVTCCVRLHTLLHVVGCCCVLLRKVWNRPNFSANNSQHFFCSRDRQNVAQQCWIRLHGSSNIVGATHAHYHGLQRRMGCILPMMHCMSQHCWELWHPFAHYCQHVRNNSQHSWRNSVGSCCIRLHAALRSLSIFFSLSFAGLPPDFSFSLSFSCSIFQICRHDIILILFLDNKDTFLFPVSSLLTLCLSLLYKTWARVAMPFFRQNNLELYLGWHSCWLSYFTLVCPWCGRTVGRAGGRMVAWLLKLLGWADYPIFLPMVLHCSKANK